MTRLQLKAQKRKIIGKKVKGLRREGFIPANVYGKKIKSQAIKIDYLEFSKIYKKAGETSILDVIINKAKTPYHTLIREVQLEPVFGKILHVDFMAVDLKEKIQADIPIRLSGESPAVVEKKALLIQELNELSVEAAAGQLPDEIVINVENLKKVGDIVRAKDIKLDNKIEIKEDKERVIVRLADLVAKKTEEEEKKAEEESAEAEKEEGKEDVEKKEDEAKEEKEESASKAQKETENAQKNPASQASQSDKQ